MTVWGFSHSWPRQQHYRSGTKEMEMGPNISSGVENLFMRYSNDVEFLKADLSLLAMRDLATLGGPRRNTDSPLIVARNTLFTCSWRSCSPSLSAVRMVWNFSPTHINNPMIQSSGNKFLYSLALQVEGSLLGHQISRGGCCTVCGAVNSNHLPVFLAAFSYAWIYSSIFQKLELDHRFHSC